MGDWIQFGGATLVLACASGCGNDSSFKFAGISGNSPVTSLSAPSGGTIWTGTQKIRWSTADADPKNVRIEVSMDSGVTYPVVLASGAPDTGTFSWHTNPQGEGNAVRVRVTPTDQAGNTGLASVSAVFTLDHRPRVTERARYEDRDLDGVPDAGDVIIVPFRTEVALVGTTATDFLELLPGMSFGSTATVAVGPATDEITITLGASTSFKTRQAYDALSTDTNPASGVNLVAGLTAGTLVNPDGNFETDVAGSAPIDILPGFVDSGQSTDVFFTTSVCAGDVDGDGDLDYLEGNLGQPSVVWFNDGAGVFSNPTAIAGFGSTRTVCLADMDMDGDIDLLLGNADGEADELWYNDGTGSFTRRQLFGASDTWAFAAGDFDRDGDIDVVAADNTSLNTYWKNTGGLLFADAAQAPFGGMATRALDAADVDGDGDLDLVEGNWDEEDKLWLFDPATGTFSESVTLGSGKTAAVAFGDLDCDGDPDLVVADGDEGTRVWLNSGGQFADSGQVLESAGVQDVILVDADADGALDLIAAIDGANRFWWNDGRATFFDSRQRLGDFDSVAIAAGDADGDGDHDLIVGNNNQSNRVWLQSLAGTWGGTSLVNVPPSMNGGGGQRAGICDLDKDGDMDFVAFSIGPAGFLVYLNDGTGALLLAQSTGVNAGTGAVGDVNGDGFPDAVVFVSTGDPDRVFLNDGMGLLVEDTGLRFDSGIAAETSLLLDVDGDGDLDYVISALGASPIQIWRNDGLGVFTDSGQRLGVGPFATIESGDFDGDGDQDLASQSFVLPPAGLVHFYRNTGGTFTEYGSFASLPSSGDYFLKFGDFDQDGDLDLYELSESDLSARVRLNPGDGTFNIVDHFHDATGILVSSFHACELADLNGDGSLDVAIYDASSPAMGQFRTYLWTETGAGGGPGFSDSAASTLATVVGFQAVLKAADMDCDGDTDLLYNINDLVRTGVLLNR